MFQSSVVDDLRDPKSFDRAYRGPICAALRGALGLGDADAEAIAQGFLVDRVFREGSDLVVLRATLVRSFRSWLFVALKRYAIDQLRRDKSWNARALQKGYNPSEAGVDQAASDSMYVMCVMHLALQKMRHHRESAGKPELWEVFDECVVKTVLEGRRPRSNEEIAHDHPGWNAQTVSNRLVTATRIFRRILPEVIPPAMSDRDDPESRFEEWFELMLRSHAGRDNLLHLAFRVTPTPSPGGSAINSMHLAGSPAGEQLSADELRILLDFRLSLPLESYLGKVDSFYVRGARGQVSPTLLSLVTLGAAVRPSDLLGLLSFLKAGAKSVHEDRGHGVPAEIIKVIYNVAVALALVECGEWITSLPKDQVRKNFRRTLSYPWLDPRLRGVFEAALDRLERP